jgi:hypothetical protein
MINLPFFLNPVYMAEQSYWLTIGEALRGGTMYLDIWDSMAPLAATMYWLVVVLFGKSVLALNILGALLNFIIAVLINNILIRNKVYEQNTYVPAFVFVIISSLHHSFSSFSPAQMGIAFVLLALGNLLGHVEFRAKRDEQIMNIGLYEGVAVLFFFPLVIFIPITLLLFIIFTSTIRRRYLLFLAGSFMPLALAFCYYWLVTDKSGYFTGHFIIPHLRSDQTSPEWVYLGKVALPLLLFVLLGAGSVGMQRRLNNYQNRLNQLFIMVTLLAPAILFFTSDVTPDLLVIFLPMATFFIVHFLLVFKRGLVGEIITIIFMGIMIFSLLDDSRQITGWFARSENKPRKRATSEQEFTRGKKIMVLGDKKELYYRGSLATPFFDWSLSAPFFKDLDYYDNQVFLLESIERQQPEVIIDYEQLWPEITRRLPMVDQRYRQVHPQIWVRR